MEKEKLDRLSELTKLARERALSEPEQAEREALRQEYIRACRANMEAVLEGVQVRQPDGTLKPLRKKAGDPQ